MNDDAKRSAAGDMRGRYNTAVAQWHVPTGSKLLHRTTAYADWVQSIREEGNWLYLSAVDGRVCPRTDVRNDAGERRSGLTFACQDYLSLSSHPRVHEAAIGAIRDHGVHSAGSGAYYGGTRHSVALEAELGAFLGAPAVTLFPAGWMAGYGVVQGLVRADDHVVLDQYAHACLQQGARAATRKIKRTSHLSIAETGEALRRIRADDARNGILVITESLFSMHSDIPDLRSLQNLCREYEATLLVDVAHDLGAMGPNGGGALETQAVLGDIDLLIGSFSKTFGSNGGFVASRQESVRQWLKGQSNAHIFSNAMSPVQCAIVRAALSIVASDEGRERRQQVARVSSALRKRLASRGLTCPGEVSPIVPVDVGELAVVRVAAGKLFERGVFVNTPEFPAVPLGQARLRMQVMSDHSVDDANEAADAVAQCVEQARVELPSDAL